MKRTAKSWNSTLSPSKGLSGKGRKRKSISPASKAQRDKVNERACLICRGPGPCHPAHVIDRSLGGCDDANCVVPLCPTCHRAYDEQGFDLLPYLEPHWREEQAHAVMHLGMARAYARVTNERKAA